MFFNSTQKQVKHMQTQISKLQDQFNIFQNELQTIGPAIVSIESLLETLRESVAALTANGSLTPEDTAALDAITLALAADVAVVHDAVVSVDNAINPAV